MAFLEGGLGETNLWGRSARKTCPWAGFQRRPGRKAPDGKEWFPPDIFSRYPFTAPMVMPRVKNFWKSRKMMMMGMEPRAAPAIMRP